MKQGKPLITFVMVLLAAALACYFAYYVWQTFQDPFTTTYAYEYTLNDSVEAEGVVVRSEQVLSGAQGILDVTRGEGEQVGVGQTVALVYRDDQAQQTQEQQESLLLEITQLRYAIGQSGDVSSVAQVDEEIIQDLVALRGSSALHDYSTLEDQVLEIKGNVLRREYSYGADLTVDDLNTRLAELTAQYTTLQSQNYNAVTQITAPQAGTFSTLVDGYESLITPESVLQLTPRQSAGAAGSGSQRRRHCRGQAHLVQGLVLCRPGHPGGGGSGWPPSRSRPERTTQRSPSALPATSPRTSLWRSSRSARRRMDRLWWWCPPTGTWNRPLCCAVRRRS